MSVDPQFAIGFLSGMLLIFGSLGIRCILANGEPADDF
jgi:hypothetical protein